MDFADGIIIGIIVSIALLCLIVSTLGWIWLVKIFNDIKIVAIAETKKDMDL